MARTIDWIGNFHAIASCDAQMPNVDARRSRNRGSLRDRFGALSVDTAVLDDEWLSISTRAVFRFWISLSRRRSGVCVLQLFAIFAF